MADPTLPVGTEVRTAAGNQFVKIADDVWRVRAEWGVLDGWTDYSDSDVNGEVIGETRDR